MISNILIISPQGIITDVSKDSYLVYKLGSVPTRDKIPVDSESGKHVLFTL